MRLIITEKASVAASISSALGMAETKKHDGYIEAGSNTVTWCVGHLIEMAEPAAYSEEYKKWNLDKLPIIPEKYRYDVKKETRKQFETVKKLLKSLKDGDELVEATDSGREGELIFRLVYLMSGCHKPFKRLWISSMEEAAIRYGMQNLLPGDRYDNLYQAALCRQKADWLIGMNGTRLFTCLHRGKVKKVGRVQTPTLAMITERDQEIADFRKEPFYTVELNDGKIHMRSDHLKTKEEAEILAKKCEGQPVSVKGYITKEVISAPPKLFDLTALQREANNIFSFTAKQTLNYLQSLYEKKLVTYPRTDSRYLTEDMISTAANMVSLVRSMIGMGDAVPDINRILDSKKVTDHHAIIPTAQIAGAKMNELPDSERKILELIMLRMAEATSKPCITEKMNVDFECAGTLFHSVFEESKQKGYKAYTEMFHEKYSGSESEHENEDEEISQNTSFDIMTHLPGSVLSGNYTSEVKSGTTKPRPHYTEATLLNAMETAGVSETDKDAERKGLGTPATRADIIEKLVRDGYVKRKGKTLTATEEGMYLISIVPERLKSPVYTAEWENKLSLIAKGEASPEDFLNGIEQEVRQMTAENIASQENNASKEEEISYGKAV